MTKKRTLSYALFTLLIPATAAAMDPPRTITGNTTLTGPVNGPIIIGRNNIYLDCANNLITGDGTGSGIQVKSHQYITISNCKITKFSTGVDLQSTDSVEIYNTAATHCTFGFYSYLSAYTYLQDFTGSDNAYGLVFSSSDWNFADGVDASNNTYYGAYLYDSDNNHLKGYVGTQGKGFSANGADGILISSSSYNTVDYTNITFSKLWPVTISNGSNNTVKSNFLYKNGTNQADGSPCYHNTKCAYPREVGTVKNNVLSPNSVTLYP